MGPKNLAEQERRGARNRIHSVISGFLVSLENRGARIRDILLPLFSFIFLRNILEGMLEKEHLFGSNPYPFRSFLILFIHFPLFYFCLFLMLCLVFYAFYPRDGAEPFTAFKKVASSIAHMFWIILIPPLLDLVISAGRGYDLTYILKDAGAWTLISMLFRPDAGQYGVSPGMRIEIALALLLCFAWIFVKRRNILLSLLGTVSVYFLLLFAGVLPLFISSISGSSFADFYGAGGILYFDTQKFAGVFYALLFVLGVICCLLFFRRDLRRIFGFGILNAGLVVAMLAGFLWGFKKFHAAVPDLWAAPDLIAVVVLIISGFLALRTDMDRADIPVVLIGLTGTLIISYYTFLALVSVRVLLMLGRKLNRSFRALIIVPAFFFAFLAGLAVFTHERAFSSLAGYARHGNLAQKTKWNDEETVIRRIEETLKNADLRGCAGLLGSKPYFVSPAVVLYLEGLFNIQRDDLKKAGRLLDGAIGLGYRTERVLLSRADLYAATREHAEAIVMYKKVLAGGATYGRIHSSLASEYYEVQDYRNSITHYRLAIKKSGKDPVLYNNLGVVYLKIGDLENARAVFLHALELDPQMEQAKKNLVLVEAQEER